ncbi:ATP-binding protein [Thermobifida alba]|uniref:ATP-binding protein n=1 Tax=Thermobifida alba TaxID=53522 RepID=A0ABY4KXI8_THEAE|nr:ATP-binding protein [Thermobifida alba]UPT19750.1 ATP-binding protein [Thermobifida alba]
MTDNTNDTGHPGSGRLCVVSEFWELSGDPALCPDLRHRVRASLAGFPHVVDDAELVAAELFANACRHSRSGQGGKVSVSLSALRTGLVLVTVADQGPRPDPHTGGPRIPQARPPGDPLTVGGRGLRLVAALATDWGHWTTEDGGHSVWAVFEPPLPAFAHLSHRP